VLNIFGAIATSRAREIAERPLQIKCDRCNSSEQTHGTINAENIVQIMNNEGSAYLEGFHVSHVILARKHSSAPRVNIVARSQKYKITHVLSEDYVPATRISRRGRGERSLLQTALRRAATRRNRKLHPKYPSRWYY
jgi:hypothetical protein